MKYFLLLIASLLSFFGAGAKVFYVDAGATGANNGASWANAYKYLSDALTAAQASGTSDSVYIAQGTYYPTGAQSGANRDASFLIRQSGKLKIYGGFPAGGGVRNAAANPTILSGDIGTAGTQTDNSYHVVVIAGLSAAADSVVLDGLRIQWGRASGSNNFSYNSQNIPRNKGGGIVAYGNANDNKLTIRNCIISGNYASDAGAGICNSATSPLLVNVLLSGNYADYGGGMINGAGSDARIINCTIAGNHDNNGGGGMRNSSSTPIIANTIIYGNKGGISNNSSAPVITYSLVQGLVGGTGNLGSATNPQFISPVASGTVNVSGDYRLNKTSSIAINAGRNDSIPSGIVTDLDGSARRFHGDSVDMGAYEASGFNVFVDGTNGNDASDGRSWAAAFKTLSKAVYISQQIAGSLYQNVDSILVAKGTYYPTGAQNGINRESTFLFLRGNLKVYGGYPTGGGVRNPATNPTIMSGNIASAGTAADNSFHVVGIGNLTTDSLVIDGFQITGGNADGSGTVTVADVVLDRGNGGGVSMITNGNNPKIAIRNCQITNNAAKFGGGIYCLVGSAPALLNCIISGNTAVNLGGGLYLSYSNASLKNVLLHSNNANSGSGIYCTTVTGDLINVTQANNSGTGFYAENGTVNWKNSIVWDVMSGNGYSTSYSLVKGVNSTANNNVADPGFAATDVFINPAGNNFSLFQCSPVANAGSNGFVSGTSTDISGNPRIYNNGTVDLGAYEYQGNGFAASNRIFVDGLNGNDNNSGTTWAAAFKTLSYALAKTQSNEICYSTIDSILVAKGTYYPTGVQNGTNRDSTFLFKRGKLKVYGGYPNGGGTRNISLNPTILSGNIGNPADSTDNSFHVAVLVGINTDSLVIDGFRIQNGTANLNATYNYNGTSFDSRHGGGVSVITNSSNPKIALRNCSFIRNYSGFWGGGLFVWDGKLSLDNCVFYENVGGIGGGIYTSGATINLNRCTFSFNSASDGGGIATVYLSTLNITNCLFTNNIAAYVNSSGGGLFNYLSDVNTYNTTFANNNGGSGYKEGGVTYWNNSIIWDVISGNNYTTNNCLLKGKTSTANGNLSAAGLTAGSIFANPATNDFSLLPCSPVINAGSNALAAGITTDISGNPRIYGSGTVDLGAYEYQGAPVPFNKIYVDSTNGSDENNGASWAYPFRTLSYALSKVHGSELCFSTVDSILVAKGTYYPTGAQSGTNRTTSFVINRGNLKVYGGYPSGGGTRNIAGNPTILSGDIGTANNNADNSYHVMVVVGNITDSVVVDGFEIAYGKANSSSAYSYSGTTISADEGGGIVAFPATTTAKIWIRNCYIANNAADYGAGIYWQSNHLSGITNCTVFGNTATSRGGGIYNYYTNATTLNSHISGNSANQGGGIFSYYADPVVRNSLIANNTGDGIYDYGTNSSFRNVTTANNTSDGYYRYQGTTSWQNSIIWDNINGGTPTTQNCLIKGKTSTANNNIPDPGYTAADIFANPTAGDYSLMPCSPVLNLGNNSYIAGYTTDISGNPRIYNNGTVDLGAYEFQGNGFVVSNKIYVDSLNGNDNNNGTSWASAFKTLSFALNRAQGSAACYGTNVDSILVAKGTYYPTGAQSGANRDSTFLISRGKLKLYGGYPSGGGARNIAGNPTILSGDIGTANNDADNSYHVVVIAGVSADSAVIDGLTIEKGNANGSGSGTYNGVSIDRGDGAGLSTFSNAIGRKVEIRNCMVRNNAAVNYGGIRLFNSDISIRGCTLSNNSAGAGGALYIRNSTPLVGNSIFFNNTAVGSGGGVAIATTTAPEFVNCLFYGNNASSGGAISNTSGNARFTNVTLINNGTTGFRALGYTYWENSIIWDNINGTAYDTYNSLVKGKTSTANNNIPDPGYTAADIFANPTANDYSLLLCSPAINAGDNSFISGYTTDISGNSRIYNNGTVDLGAYEFQGMASYADLSSSAANGIPLTRTCEENGWTWYADPSKANSLSFAIQWGTTNNNAKTAAGVFLHAVSGNTLASNGTSQAIITMKRYWNVDLHGTTLTTPVSVRFLFNAADTSEMHATINSAVNSSGNKLVWFKTTGSLFNPNQVTFNDINGGNFIPLVPVYGIANGIPYVEFSGITSFSGGTAGIRAGGGAPLPVTLLSFTAQLTPDNQQALLSWQAADESLQKYEIARSTDGAKSWNIVGALPAAGHEQYQFQDKLTGVTAHDNKVFYRLRLVENNGSFNYSKTSYVLLPAEKQPAITVSPNPFKETFIIRNPIPALNGKQTQITDDLGRLKEAFVLETTVSIDASQWIPGVYLIRFPNGEVVKVVRE